MRAVVIREHGGPEKLEFTEIDPPVPRPGEALVRVRAVALNHLDIWVRRGVPGHKFPLPIVPGCEVAGVIERIEGEAASWKAGDEVIVAPGFSCGLCEACLNGNDPLCRYYGIYGETVNGGCTAYIAVPIPDPPA
jgi:D-arabinose 1-dehydrogenase-like Zn-dependent alcohol dehydrogenase